MRIELLLEVPKHTLEDSQVRYHDFNDLRVQRVVAEDESSKIVC